ncbi:carboxypeptidase regulatory-like domain-containing protein [Patescibacteria group bacterium]|nr:carboxypeptidase regulatory-like domain-containing protein [Patescibacteria group bacterium]
MINKPLLLLGIILSLSILTAWILLVNPQGGSFIELNDSGWWKVQSIDTVKYSRDLAREKNEDITFDETIELQVKRIAETGATHISIGTPYDEEFLPFLTRWVEAARRHDLKVWFRGNFSGWERWFGYEKITRGQHLAKTREFILDNGELFEDGDIFSSCTECENGGPGDPRRTGDLEGYRRFLIEEHKAAKEAFRAIGKSVLTNYNPMNGDVARLVMDEDTTQALGGIVVIDHYVEDPEQLLKDIKAIARRSGGKVVLGEFGAPIPDIHGRMSEKQQAKWLERALTKTSTIPELIGVNYWTGFGGSSQLWDSKGEARMAVSELTKFYSPKVLHGYVRNELGRPIAKAKLSGDLKTTETGKNGEFYLPYVSEDMLIKVTASGYLDKQLTSLDKESSADVIMEKKSESIIFEIQKFFYK